MLDTPQLCQGTLGRESDLRLFQALTHDALHNQGS